LDVALICSIRLAVGNTVHKLVRIIRLEKVKKKRQVCLGVDYIFQWEEPDLLQ